MIVNEKALDSAGTDREPLLFRKDGQKMIALNERHHAMQVTDLQEIPNLIRIQCEDQGMNRSKLQFDNSQTVLRHCNLDMTDVYSKVTLTLVGVIARGADFSSVQRLFARGCNLTGSDLGDNYELDATTVTDDLFAIPEEAKK